MVKGVNKTIIEVNETGSEMFDRIIFYVAPKYGNLSSNQLHKELGRLNLDYKPSHSLRKRVKLRKRRVALLVVALLLIGAGITCLFIF